MSRLAQGDIVDNSDETSTVYLPAHPAIRGTQRMIRLERRADDHGEPLVVAFSRLDLLVAALGRAQPWVAMPLGGARRLAAATGTRTLAIDPTVPAGASRWTESDLALVGGSASAQVRRG
jgi:hypothetical protein